MTTPIWFVTGASSGLGAEIAEAALKAGNKVIATARDPAKAAREFPQIEALGGAWLQFDVTASDVREKVQKTIEAYGRIDVVVNNAGYSLLGGIEDFSEAEIHKQFDTNVYGPIRTIQAVVPSMRAQKSGTIVNISSVGGLAALPSCSMYSGTKFALEGISESLAQDLAPFNIRTLLVEPGLFRTKFFATFQTPAAGTNPAYQDTALDNAMKRMKANDGKQTGDPAKAAARIVDVVMGTGLGEGKTDLLRLPLGPDCMKRAYAKAEGLKANLEAMECIAASTDYEVK